MAEFDTEIIDHVTWNDDDKKVTASILDMIHKGADIVVCTGGMSVDPDDKTPLAIKIPEQILYLTEHRYFRELCLC